MLSVESSVLVEHGDPYLAQVLKAVRGEIGLPTTQRSNRMLSTGCRGRAVCREL